MRLEAKEVGLIAVGAVFVGIFAYLGWCRSTTGQPRYENSAGPEAATAALSVIDMAVDSLDTGDHYFHPCYCVPGQTQIFTQHKYPSVSGGNISTLIHYGMDRLSKPAPQDSDWIQRPPGEVMWLCPNQHQNRNQSPGGLARLPGKSARCLCGPGWE